MTDNRTTELLPCPFCGGEASVKVLEYDDDCRVWGVFCESDLESEYSHGHFVDNYPTEAEAIAVWNTRAERTCHIVTTWSDSDYLDDVNYRCSECGGLIVVDERNPDDYFEIISHANYCCNCGAKVVDNAD